jgi:ATP-dependent Zn protease
MNGEPFSYLLIGCVLGFLTALLVLRLRPHGAAKQEPLKTEILFLFQAMTPREKRILAAHEAGHVLAAWLAPHVAEVSRATIVRSGHVRGGVIAPEDGHQGVYTRTELLWKLMVMLGSRAAEEFLLDEPTNLCNDDLTKADDLALEMATRHAMGYCLGLEVWNSGMRDAAPKDHERILVARERFKNTALREIRRLFLDRLDPLKAVFAALQDRHTLEAKDIEALLGPRPERPLKVIETLS